MAIIADKTQQLSYSEFVNAFRAYKSVSANGRQKCK